MSTPMGIGVLSFGRVLIYHVTQPGRFGDGSMTQMGIIIIIYANFK